MCLSGKVACPRSPLMEACRPAVTAACRQRLIDHDDVDDAVQETFVKLACRAGGIRGDVGAWLHSAAVTTAIDFTRRAARRRHHLLLAASDGLLERPEGLSWEAIQHRLEDGLAGLDADSRSLVIARFLDGIPVHVLARQRRVTSSAVSNRVARATAKLRKALRDVGFDSLDDAAGGMVTRPFA